MSSLEGITAALLSWIDAVARAMRTPLDGIKPPRRIEVMENDDGSFTMRPIGRAKVKESALDPLQMQIADGELSAPLSPNWAAAVRGSRIDLVLRPSRFLFRPLELPSRAAEFLDGIIRSQIDRLTPWAASEATYRWTPPRAIAGERIAMTIVACARAAVTPFSQAFSNLGAAGIEISTATEEGKRITVYDQHAAARTDVGRLRIALIGGLAATGFMAALSFGAAPLVADHYDTQRQQIQRRISERRAMISGSQTGANSSALDLLERRKQSTPSSVLVIDALSALLPDHTYATEIRIEGDKLQVIGVSRDAPSLIQILERSPHFSRAAFFAPTTRASNEVGERFHIEARIKPYFGAGT